VSALLEPLLPLDAGGAGGGVTAMQFMSWQRHSMSLTPWRLCCEAEARLDTAAVTPHVRKSTW